MSTRLAPEFAAGTLEVSTSGREGRPVGLEPRAPVVVPTGGVMSGSCKSRVRQEKGNYPEQIVRRQ